MAPLLATSVADRELGYCPSSEMMGWARGDTGGLNNSKFAQPLLETLLAQSVVLAEDLEDLPDSERQSLQQCQDNVVLLEMLVEARLLTCYQAARVAAGRTFGLVLGNYRVLEKLGAGGMGVVYKGEHVRMRRPVAIKVFAQTRDQDRLLLMRFCTEMRVVAQLNHPNIVSAVDAGEIHSSDPDVPVLHYFVMEYVQGQDLEAHVSCNGPMAATRACEIIYQVASALAEAHKHNLVHRDIKPSNILVMPDQQAKLLDFGLAMQFRNRLTEPGTVLGTVDFLAPEQARDSSSVDIRADIYGLGGTLFWCLTGQTPFPARGSFTHDLLERLTKPAPSVRTLAPEVPPDLEAVVARMMAFSPDDRYQTPQSVMRALLPFLRAELTECHGLSSVRERPAANASRASGVLIVDDEPDIRQVCLRALQSGSVQCEVASNGLEALALTCARPFDLILLDVDMPGMNGLEVCRRLRELPPSPHLKVIMFSGRSTGDELAQMLQAGADDYLTKPFSIVQLQARIQASLRLKEAQERSDLLNRQLLSVNGELERNLSARDSDLIHARNALVLALAKLVEHRHTETGAHLARMQRYTRCLAEEAAQSSPYAADIDKNFIQMIECCAPLHDIGKVGLPDHILMNPGKLTPDERILMQAHTIIGADTLQAVARQHGSALAFLQMATDFARHHHERFDGTGYPDRLAGTAIPLAARLVSLADVYDALRCRRVYKPALSQAATLQIMTESQGHFDPALMLVLLRCAPALDKIHQEIAD